MSEIFTPDPGDTVEFWNDGSELWETGTVFSRSANHRTYFVQPDDENQPMHVVEYTCIRPQTDPEPAVPSFWEAAKTYCRANVQLANTVNALQAQIDAAPYETGAPVGDKVAARIAEYRERAEKAEADLKDRRNRVAYLKADRNEQLHRASSLYTQLHRAQSRVSDLEADRDGWVQEAKDNEQIARIAHEERDYWKNRAELTHLQHVAANKRADDAEAELDEMKAALRTLAGTEKPAEFPTWVMDDDEEHWEHTGGGLYTLEGSAVFKDRTLASIESEFGIRERSDS